MLRQKNGGAKTGRKEIISSGLRHPTFGPEHQGPERALAMAILPGLWLRLRRAEISLRFDDLGCEWIPVDVPEVIVYGWRA
jgi:hypothetical protein